MNCSRSVSRGGRRWSIVALGWAAVVWMGLSGCGQQQYEKRLDETKALFSRIELLDANLGGEFADGVVKLRVPKQFRPIPAPPPRPKPKPAAPGEPAPEPEPVFDPRQPDFANIELPGMRAAFRAEVGTAVEGSSTVANHSAYVYVLSNHGLAPKPVAAAGDAASATKSTPAQFAEDVARLLAEALQSEVQPGRHTNEWVKESHPRNVTSLFPAGSDNPFPQQNYAVGSLSATVRDIPTDFSLYLREEGSVQVLIIYAVPRDVLPTEQISPRRDLSLETVRVLATSTTSSPVAAPGAPGTGGAAPGAAF